MGRKAFTQGARATSLGRETIRLEADFSPLDLIEELSRSTAPDHLFASKINFGLTLKEATANPEPENS